MKREPKRSKVFIPEASPIWAPDLAERQPSEPEPLSDAERIRWGLPPERPPVVLGQKASWRRPDSNWEEDEEDAPGAEDPTDPMVVPPEILELAQRAAKRWDMEVYDWKVAATKPEKSGAIWRIETSEGPRSFKLLHRPLNRNLFSIHAQEYLHKRGARVPAMVRSKKGLLCEVVEDRVFMVTDWIEGLVQASKVDVEGAAVLCYGLGEFHRHSQGYRPPEEAYFATRIHRWPGAYAKMESKIGWFEELARAYPEMPASPALLEVAGRFRAQAAAAQRRLENSAYRKLIARGEAAWGLVHQDYGWSNGQLGPGGVWVIDLDGVAFDLPIRDLRKLISSTMDDRGDWDLHWMQSMIDAYREANPIEPDLLQVMLIDMSLPNEFYKLVKDIVFNPAEMNPQLEQMIFRLVQTEEFKWQALEALGLKGR